MNMDRRQFGKLVGALTVAPALIPAKAHARPRRWELVADVAECCSCAIPCSCNFGRPEPGTCHGTRLIRIREGQLEGADLAGIDFVVTFEMRVWTRIYIDDRMDPSRSAALDRLLPVAFAGFDRQARAKLRVPLTIEERPDGLRYSVPESTVEMKLLPGLDGSRIVITGLPNPAYREYVQHESVVHTHRSADATWSYAGTNGFRSVMRVNG
ncbi:MAG: DUF1326 domain-containing protein [Gemmatimonadales bacterium]